MLRDAVVALAKQRLQRTNDPAIGDKIIAEMQSAQQEMEQNLTTDMPWFLLSEDLSTQTTIGEERIAVPPTMLREYEDGALFILDSESGNYLPLRKEDFDVMDNQYKEHGQAQPKAYAQVGQYFILRPVPDLSYTIKMRCYLGDAILSSNIENQWLKYAQEWLLAEALTKVALFHMRDPELASFMAAGIPEYKNKVYIAGIARKMANMNMSIGDDP